jgi:hypothetical protein
LRQPHEQDDGHHHQRRGRHPGRSRYEVTAKPRVDQLAAEGDGDEHERSEQLAEQPPPLISLVADVLHAGVSRRPGCVTVDEDVPDAYDNGVAGDTDRRKVSLRAAEKLSCPPGM